MNQKQCTLIKSEYEKNNPSWLFHLILKSHNIDDLTLSEFWQKENISF